MRNPDFDPIAQENIAEATELYYRAYLLWEHLASLLDGKLTPVAEVERLNGELMNCTAELKQLRQHLVSSGVEVLDPDPDGMFELEPPPTELI